jgi:hypothetical protein
MITGVIYGGKHENKPWTVIPLAVVSILISGFFADLFCDIVCMEKVILPRWFDWRLTSWGYYLFLY